MSEQLVTTLLDKYGTTFAEQAHITLKNEPSPLFRLLTLSMLRAKPIGADIAVQALLGLNKEDLDTAENVHSASRRTMIAALQKSGSRSLRRKLGDLPARGHRACAQRIGRGPPRSTNFRKYQKRFIENQWCGFPCADMFARNVQAVWPALAPALNTKAIQGAKRLWLSAGP